MHRSADKDVREVKYQLMESERTRLRLEEEVKGQEDKISSMRQTLDKMVCSFFFSATCRS
jgi:hypothetical protein